MLSLLHVMSLIYFKIYFIMAFESCNKMLWLFDYLFILDTWTNSTK
jgi:hypothetical protein